MLENQVSTGALPRVGAGDGSEKFVDPVQKVLTNAANVVLGRVNQQAVHAPWKTVLLVLDG